MATAVSEKIGRRPASSAIGQPCFQRLDPGELPRLPVANSLRRGPLPRRGAVLQTDQVSPKSTRSRGESRETCCLSSRRLMGKKIASARLRSSDHQVSLHPPPNDPIAITANTGRTRRNRRRQDIMRRAAKLVSAQTSPLRPVLRSRASFIFRRVTTKFPAVRNKTNRRKPLNRPATASAARMTTSTTHPMRARERKRHRQAT